LIFNEIHRALTARRVVGPDQAFVTPTRAALASA
jgi:hypothetical protein